MKTEAAEPVRNSSVFINKSELYSVSIRSEVTARDGERE